MLFKDKTVLISGGSSGIGKSIAILFAKNGADVAFSYRENRPGANEVISELKEIGGNVIAIQADLSSADAAKKLVEKTLSYFNKVDILVNNAGRYINGDEWNGEEEIWESSIKQNLLSTISVSKYALQYMQSQKKGVIINISSRYSVAGQYDSITYAASKAGIINVTQAQAKLMAPWGRANAISPGNVNSGYWLTAPKKELKETIKATPMSSLISTEDIAEAVVFLASDKAKMITGQNLIIDGGYSLI